MIAISGSAAVKADSPDKVLLLLTISQKDDTIEDVVFAVLYY